MKSSQAIAKDRLARRLAAYTLAAGAALALPQAAGAEIVCGNIDTALHLGDSPLSVDLDSDGTDDLTFQVGSYGGSTSSSVNLRNGEKNFQVRSGSSSSSFPTYQFFARVAVANDAEMMITTSAGYQMAVNMPTSIDIPPGSANWVNSTSGYLNVVGMTSSGPINAGNFNNGTPGYLGLRFRIDDDVYLYGWIEYTADTDFATFGGTIGRWAYETEVNRPITPGDTGTCGQVGPVPDPGPGPAPTPGQPQAGATNNGGCFISAGSE